MTTPIIAAEVVIKDVSGTITLGGIAQVLMPAGKGRGGYWIQNVSDSELWISDVGTADATQPSMMIAAGGMYESPITGCSPNPISIFGVTTAQAFSAREWRK